MMKSLGSAWRANNSQVAVPRAIGAAAVLLLLTACLPLSTSASDDYPTEVRANFVNACEAQPGATESMCTECLEKVEKEFTFKEFAEMEVALQAGTLSRKDTDRFAEVMLDCA